MANVADTFYLKIYWPILKENRDDSGQKFRNLKTVSSEISKNLWKTPRIYQKI